MDSGVPGVPGVAVLRPVDKDGSPGLETVTLQHQLMEEMTVKMEMKLSLRAVTINLVKVRIKQHLRVNSMHVMF